MPRLRLRQIDADNRPIRLGADPISIGRHPANTIPIDDEKASRKHCLIERVASGSFRVRDLGSRNGTRLNGFGVMESPLAPGDVIQIGKTEFLIEEAIGSDSGEGHPSDETRAAVAITT